MERKTIHLLRSQQNRSASKALWPPCARKCVATTRVAQRRRQFVMQGLWWFALPLRPSRASLPRLSALFQRLLHMRTTHIVLALIIGCLVQMLCMFYNWSILLVLTAMCTTTTLIVIHLVCETKDSARSNKTSVSSAQPLAQPEMETTISPLQPIMQSQFDTATPQPLLPVFPTTPMPDTPLVRVLDTIDLSSTNVEHFLNVPNTSLGTPTEEQTLQDTKEAVQKTPIDLPTHQE